MIRAALCAASLMGSASLAGAEPLLLAFPVDCTLGETCYIQQYVDHDPGPGARDFTCGGLSYDGHKGTDFGLPTHAAMAQGVDVLAAAPGVVGGTRDGMEDRLFNGEDLGGRDCGNGVVLRHADGWESQYCHLQKGSLRVEPGQKVDAGEVLGRVGLSGRTQFPHLHLSLRHEGAVIDPFAPDGAETCGSGRTLWNTRPSYTPGGLLDIGFAPGVPDFDAVQAGTADDIPPDRHSAMVGFALAFGGQQGDVLEIMIDGPTGEVVATTIEIDRTQASFFRAAGRRRQPGGWAAGTYDLTVRLRRDGVVLDRRFERIELR